jgi:cytosine deaminase
MTRVPELMAAGLTVAFGHDCVLDPWYSGGSADMLEAAHMGLHVGQMTSQAAMRQCFDAVTTHPARLLGLEGYGLATGCHADFVLLHARDPAEAIHLRATRLAVYRRGKKVASSPAPVAALALPGRPDGTDFLTR